MVNSPTFEPTCDTREGWTKTLASLPNRRGDSDTIPSFFFAHGHPGIYFDMSARFGNGLKMQGHDGTLAQFLRDFGPALLEKYKPKAIVVFSAHWETAKETLVTDYGEDQPLLYDYYGFPESCYTTQWHSRGSHELSTKVVESLKSAGLKARTTKRSEPRGQDAKVGPKPGLDHGVFIPFKLMFPEGENGTFPIPVVQVSINESLKPLDEIKLGQAVSSLRQEGILVLAGGLTIHTFRDFSAWHESTASSDIINFENAIVDAVNKPTAQERKDALIAVTGMPGFKIAHPRAEHFVPIYIAMGAGNDGDAKVISDIFGAKTIAFGL